ncbi:MAG TPA: hypothetical protein O0X27_05295 [Methanocorpusculum sp.]|nr:hypothetical protein [Methanocorpusculum sp.]
MRPLPPTLRLNRRYILIEVMTDAEIPAQKEIYLAGALAAQNLFGDCGAAELRPAVVWSEGSYAIVRCTRGTELRMIAALACVVKAGACGAGTIRFRTVTVSGTIHGAKKAIRTA